MRLNNLKKVIAILVVILLTVLGVVLASEVRNFVILQRLNRRDTPSEVAIAFMTALRVNHETAYELAIPEVWPRLDNWMAGHTVQQCEVWGITSEISFSARNGKHSVTFTCDLSNGGRYTFSVEDIALQGKAVIINWGKIKEEIH